MDEKRISDILKGIGGHFEITRVLGVFGVLAYIVVANGLAIYYYGYLQHSFDVVAYCAAFPSGLGVAIAAVGITAGVKDRNVAAAQVVTETNSLPAVPPSPAPTADPAKDAELPEEERI